MTKILDFFLIWWLKSGRYGWSKLYRRLFERGYLNTDLPVVNALEEIEPCLRQITWTKDGLFKLYDSISYPQAVWHKKKDDCDGFSILACELLNRLDRAYHPVLFTALVHPLSSSHSVCVFLLPDTKLGVFDNGILKMDFSDYENVAAMIGANADKMICWDVRNPDSFALLEFHKG